MKYRRLRFTPSLVTHCTSCIMLGIGSQEGNFRMSTMFEASINVDMTLFGENDMLQNQSCVVHALTAYLTLMPAL